MWLIEKEQERRIIANYDLYDMIKDGWVAVRLLRNYPRSLRCININDRSVSEIKKWFTEKIKKHLEMADDYKKQLETFEGLTE